MSICNKIFRFNWLVITNGTNCYQTVYPMLLGSNNENAALYAMDIDSSGNVAVGGTIGTSLSYISYPMIAYIAQGGGS